MFLVEREYRRLAFWSGVVAAVTLLGIAVYFGNPGNQGYTVLSAVVTSGALNDGSALILTADR